MQKSLIYNKQQIFYEVLGIGKPIILIHGFAEDATVWQPTIALLNHTFKVYNIHLPATGLSNKVDVQFCSIKDSAAIVLQIIETENINNFILVGHSMGGYIALQVAQNCNSNILKLCLLHSNIFADTAAKKEARSKQIKFLQHNETTLFLKQTIPNLFAPNFVNNKKEWLQNWVAQKHYMLSEALINYTLAMKNRKDSSTWVQKTSIPIQFIVGDIDNAVPYSICLAQASLPNISYFHTLKGVGHMGMLEATSEVALLLTLLI